MIEAHKFLFIFDNEKLARFGHFCIFGWYLTQSIIRMSQPVHRLKNKGGRLQQNGICQSSGLRVFDSGRERILDISCRLVKIAFRRRVNPLSGVSPCIMIFELAKRRILGTRSIARRT